jgi:hypothetical protein
MSKEYVAMIFIKDEDEEFTKGEIRDMIQENMLEYADNAPFSIRALKVEEI